ncbi:putative AMP-binding enzyme [Rosellinia necatrix]|uniref:Putative AMP-binding enzyme n=1 Tax=Rosellinia necatrix TaxID=77044 RepID=A0A1W2TEZ6_ROSNE|nr:putative AMP-binding enzyme [Rosellinia necatrix]
MSFSRAASSSYGPGRITLRRVVSRVRAGHHKSAIATYTPLSAIVARHRTWSPAIQQRRGFATPGMSYVEGPTDPPLLPHTIPEHFASIVSRYGDQPAVMARRPTAPDGAPGDPGTTVLTYAELDVLSDAAARSLRSLGVRKGDRVAVSLGNVAESVVMTYAVFKLGAVWVPLNPSFNAAQLSAALAHLGVEVLVIGAVTDLAYKPCRGRSNLELLTSLIPGGLGADGRAGKIESEAVPTLRHVVLVDNSAAHPASGFPRARDLTLLTPYADLVASSSSSSSSSSRPVVPDAPLRADETINIQFTSGTTSLPKAAMLSHASVLNNGHLIAARMGLVPGDRIVCPPPLFHCFGCVLGLMATATTGAGILFPSPAFDPAATLRMVSERRATGLYGVATMFVAELELLADRDSARRLGLRPDAFADLRKGIAAGSSVPESLMRRLFDVMGLRDLVICYGMTETSPVSCMTSPRDPLGRRTASVGRAMPHTAVKVVSAADRRVVLPRGQRGELAASGYLVMQGYFGDPARTAEDRIPDPDDGGRVWMYSGDEARIDEDGYVEITGRIKDLIIRGGENIHPLEVENCLFQLRGVQEVSVVGVPDARHGEAVAAFVVPHKGVRTAGGDGTVRAGTIAPVTAAAEGDGDILGKEDVQDWVRTRLSGHLVPKHVFWIDEYPKTASGKIQKYKLRDLAKELLSATSS